MRLDLRPGCVAQLGQAASIPQCLEIVTDALIRFG
jgi:hypothetical protein